MASIQKRGDTYLITVSFGETVTGKRIRETMTYIPTETAVTKIQKELQRVAVDFERRVKEGGYIDGDKLSFSEFVKRWDRDYASDRDNIGQKNYDDSMRILNSRVIPVIGQLKLNQIKAPHLMDIYKQMETDGLKPKTIRKTHSVISSVFSLAYDYALIQDNPCGRCRLPKIKDPYDYQILNQEQIHYFIDALNTEYVKKSSGFKYKDENGKICTGYTYRTVSLDLMFRLFFVLALNTGARRGELCALTWKDIDFIQRIMHITKSIEYSKTAGLREKGPKSASSVRDVPLNGECIKLLKKWHSEAMQLSLICGNEWQGYTGKDFDRNYVFIQQDTGELIHIQTPEAKMKKLIRDYNELYGEERIPNIRLHDLRHTFATHLIANGADIITVSKLLGHASPSITLDIYANHALPDRASGATDLIEKICF